MALELWRSRWGAPRGSAPELSRFPRDVDDLVGRLFRDWGWGHGPGEARGWSPAVDMVDRNDEIVLRADLPGLEQKDIEVTVDNGLLTIRGERREEHEAKDDDYYCCERWSGSFVRTLALPAGIDADRVKATFKNGVLEVHLPKTKETAGKKIEIKAA